ncbi:hypothetical protein ACLMJK_003040 [Lecanora helva]
MHFSFSTAAAALLLALPFAATQSLNNLPSCAQPAIEVGITHTTCALTDYTCICGSTGFINGIKSQIESACSASDQQATLAFAKQVCAAAGATLEDDEPSSDAAPAASAAAAPAASEPAASAAAAPAESAAPAAGEEAPSSTGVTVPTSTPLYPTGNGTTGSLNGTNSTTAPFLGTASSTTTSNALLNIVVAAVLGGLALGAL